MNQLIVEEFTNTTLRNLKDAMEVLDFTHISNEDIYKIYNKSKEVEEKCDELLEIVYKVLNEQLKTGGAKSFFRRK